MPNISEPSARIVKANQPKTLIGWSQKASSQLLLDPMEAHGYTDCRCKGGG